MRMSGVAREVCRGGWNMMLLSRFGHVSHFRQSLFQALQSRIIRTNVLYVTVSAVATPLATGVSPGERMDAFFAEIAELTGQRNAIDGRLVEIVAEMDRDGLWGATGARS